MEGKDDIFCEEIEVGEERPRTVMSGLRKYFTEDQLLHRKVVVITNLKPRRVGSFVSEGMVICAVNGDRSVVEFVEPPKGALVGEVIQFEGLPAVVPDEEVNPNRKTSPWGKCAESLRVTEEGVAAFQNNAFMTSAGKCTVKSLKDAQLC